MNMWLFLQGVHTLFQKSEGRDRIARLQLFLMKLVRGLLRHYIARRPELLKPTSAGGNPPQSGTSAAPDRAKVIRRRC